MTTNVEVPIKTQEEGPNTVELPSPTAWPIVLALGVALVFAGMVTTAAVSILGAILAVSGCIGWFRDVLPREQQESVPVLEQPVPVATSRPAVARVGWITHDPHRARLPIEIYPISAGVKGGLAGSAVMALLAITYGLIAQHSVWYPINLLSAGFFPEAENTTAQLSAFQPSYLILATIVHLITSLLAGLLYGAMLPMLPRHPILLGGVIAPVLWSGLIHSFLEIVDPVLNRRISWPWFVVSQIGFGIVAGIVVSKQHRIHTWQHLPFAIRAGIEAPGAMEEKDGKERRR
jgi:hypothetical protein